MKYLLRLVGDTLLWFSLIGVVSVGCYWLYELLLLSYAAHWSLGVAWSFALVGVVGGIIQEVFK